MVATRSNVFDDAEFMSLMIQSCYTHSEERMNVYDDSKSHAKLVRICAVSSAKCTCGRFTRASLSTDLLPPNTPRIRSAPNGIDMDHCMAC